MRSKSGLIVAMMAALGLGGCSSVPNALNPIEWYRDIMGLADDDSMGAGQNEQNLQEGSKEPYPNLGSVPAPPDTALSSVDRDKLVDSLVADRNNAKYSNDNLQAGRAAVTAPPPAPPGSAAARTANTPNPAPASAAPPGPLPTATAAPAPEPPAPRGAGPRRGTEAPPGESPLTSPTVRSSPQGEAAAPAPPPPQISSPNQVAMAPQRPTAPKLRPPGAGGTPASAPGAAPGGSQAAVSYRAADIRFAPGSALLGDKSRDAVAEIVKLHHDSGGKIRIIGHGGAGGANAAVTGLNLALDRAQAVAVALTDSGVPPEDVAVEAAPVAARGGADVPRAEVYLEN